MSLTVAMASGPDATRAALTLNPGGSVEVTCAADGGSLDWSRANPTSGVATCVAPVATTTTTVPASTTSSSSSTTLPIVTTTTSTTVPDRTPGAMPTSENTGPTFPPSGAMTAEQVVATGRCTNAVVSGEVHIEVNSAAGQVWTIENCVLTDGLAFAIYADYPPSMYPTINISHTDIQGSLVLISPLKLNMDDVEVTHGGFWAPCPECAGPTFDKVIAMPVTVRNSLFHHPVGSLPDHTEALHVAGAGQGYTFINTRFVQDGPVNGTQTAALFFHGGSSTFDGCYFDDGDQGVSNAFFYTVYLYGKGPGATDNVVKNSAIENGISSYVYPNTPPDPLVAARYENNRDFHSGAQLVLPQ